eukprot:scaffold38624_cov39-Phaeocystis_antarctica.AAC.4
MRVHRINYLHAFSACAPHVHRTCTASPRAAAGVPRAAPRQPAVHLALPPPVEARLGGRLLPDAHAGTLPACAPHVHRMCTACASHVHCVCIVCAPHVHCMCTAYAPQVHRMCTACASHVHRMCIACASHVHRMCITCDRVCTACALHVHYPYTACTLH